MKKTLLTAALLCGSLSSLLHAEEKGVLYLSTPINYQVLSISENGDWACGIQYDENTGTSIGFRWSLVTGKIETLGNDTYAYSISNDGTIAGSFQGVNNKNNNIEVPGIWIDGSWSLLELPDQGGAWAVAITADGQYVSGTDNNYVSYIWKEGKIDKTAEVKGVGSTFMATALSPDGTKIGGWAYYQSSNRNAGYWDTADEQFHPLIPDDPGSPWQRVIKFSADSKKLLLWGGYTLDPEQEERGYGIRALYNIESQQMDLIYPTHQNSFNFDLYDMGGNGTVVGMQQEADGAEYGIIYKNGETSYIEPYLSNLGADFSNLGIMQLSEEYHYIARAMCISSDEKRFALLCYDEDYNYFTLMVMIDQTISMLPPVCVEAEQQPGILSAEISWEKPLGITSTLIGYNLYRDDVKINSEVITSCHFYDTGLEAKAYKYHVTALYEEGESEGSETITLSMKAHETQKPSDLFVRQKGYNSLYACWGKPATNLCQLDYYDEDEVVGGFGGGTVSFETGILIPAEKLALYEGYKLTGITFQPNSPQGSWIINLYRHDEEGNLKSIRSYNVTQPLNYRESNTFFLPQQIQLQAGQDLLVGIQTNVTEASYDIQQVSSGCKKMGYSDLVRQVGEEEFVSYCEMAGEDIAWNTSILLAPAGVTKEIDEIDHYNLYLNNEKIEATEDTQCERLNLPEGSYRLSVEAVYADQRTSDTLCMAVDLTANKQQLKHISPTLNIDGTQLNATWQAPLDDDNTLISWCGDEKGTKHPTLSEGMTQLLVRTDYPSKMFKGFNNHQISSLSFFPLNNSKYLLIVYEDTEPIIEEEVPNVSIGQWNTLNIEPTSLLPGVDYRYVIYCYDCPEGEAPMAFDNNSTRSEYSNLYMAEGDETWSNADSYTGLYMQGNWMMRMNITERGAKPFPMRGYDVYVDGFLSSSLQSEVSYAQDFSADSQQHNIRVDAVYDLETPITTEGEVVNFNLDGPAAIETLSVEPSHEAYNLQGQRVGTSHGRLIKNGYKRLVIR